MSSGDIALTLEKREVIGKGLGKLRSSGSVPAVLHNHGKESIHVMANYSELSKAFQAVGMQQPINLTIDSKKYMALIKDVDFEPRKHTIRHVVFNAIRADEKQRTEVPVRFAEGIEIPAEKTGHIVLRTLDVVEIEALPKNLIDEIVVDPSALVEIGDKLAVGDLKVASGIAIVTEAEQVIAVVEESKAQMSEDSEAEEAAEAKAEDAKTE